MSVLFYSNAPRALHLQPLRRGALAKAVAWLLLACFLPLASGCHYYRNKPIKPGDVSQLADAKLFVVHEGGRMWQLNAPQLSGETLEGVRAEVAPAVLAYQQSAASEAKRYKSKDQSVVLNVVHIYAAEQPAPAPDNRVSIPLAAMQRIDLVEKDSGRTTASYVLGGLGIAAAAFVLIGVIALLTKSSCPFVYAHDGTDYRFVGEAYGGAIFAPAERNDYMPLPGLAATNNQYQVRITNELKERQYTNLAELLVVQHAAGTQVLLDKTGRVHTLGAPQVPTQARTNGGADCLAPLLKTDQNAFLFNEETPGSAPNSVVLTFDQPRRAESGKLVLRAQNSLWLDYLYGEFIQKFGSYYNTWAAEQKTLAPAVNRQWSAEQGIPLKVYLETRRGWQLIDQVETVGPLAARDIVVPLNLREALPNGPVRVKLEAGFMFWELDYAALDTSPEQPVVADNCRLLSAVNEKGRNEQPNLAADDSRYLAQLGAGTAVTLTYQSILPAATPHTQRSAFLRTKGYYEHIRNFEGLPQVRELYAFRKPGHFIAFSKAQYNLNLQAVNLVAANR